MTRTILVAGGTGALGRHIVSTLRTRGLRVRVLTRQRAETLMSLPSVTAPDADIEFRHADALDPRGLAGACDGVEAVISALGASVLPRSDSRTIFGRVRSAEAGGCEAR